MGTSEGAGDQLPDAPGARRRRRAVTLAIGAVVLVAGVAATLSRAAEHRVGTNDLPVETVFGLAGTGDTICQTNEQLPAGTAAIRVALVAGRHPAPRLAFSFSNGEQVLAAGAAGARRDSATTVVIPLARPLRAPVDGEACIRVLRGGPPVPYQLLGIPIDPAEGASVNGRPVPGRLHLEYLSGEKGSWWSFAPTVVHRIGFGHAWSGASVALLIVALTLTSIALGAWQLIRSER